MGDSRDHEPTTCAATLKSAAGEPRRVQLSRAKGWRMPPNTVKVDRSTRWGNQFRVQACEDGTFEVRRQDQYYADPEATSDTSAGALAEAVRLFSDWLHSQFGAIRQHQARADLRGKNLACWCKPGAPCHADVLLELANAAAPQVSPPIREAK